MPGCTGSPRGRRAPAASRRWPSAAYSSTPGGWRRRRGGDPRHTNRVGPQGERTRGSRPRQSVPSRSRNPWRYRGCRRAVPSARPGCGAGRTPPPRRGRSGRGRRRSSGAAPRGRMPRSARGRRPPVPRWSPRPVPAPRRAGRSRPPPRHTTSLDAIPLTRKRPACVRCQHCKWTVSTLIDGGRDERDHGLDHRLVGDHG